MTNAGGPCCNGVFLPGMPGGVPKTEVLIAQPLKDAGYRTMAVGKWHLGGIEKFHPLDYGFDGYYGCPHGLGACPVSACFCNGTTNTTVPCAIGGSPDWAPCPVFQDRTIVQQPADLLGLSNQYVSAATTFIAEAEGAEAPFFLYYASHHVHSPQFAGADTTGSTARGKFGDSLAELDRTVQRLRAAVDHL